MEINQSTLCHSSNYQNGRSVPIKYIVIHYVGATGGARNNALYYGNTPDLGASAHYYVGHASEGAVVYQSVPDNDTAWHCGRTDGKYKHPECRNSNSIGIELCCHQDATGRWYFDIETVNQALELVRLLMDRYSIDTAHVVRHYDVTGKRCPAPYVDNPEAWAKFKERLEVRDMTQEQFNVMFEQAIKTYQDKQNVIPVSEWAAESWNKAVHHNIFDGTKPGAAFTREQAAVILDRLNLI